MAVRQKQAQRGTARRAEVSITGTITFTAAGAILSQQAEASVATKNAGAGNITVAFDRKYKAGSVRFIGAMIVRPDATAFGNVAANICQGQAGTDSSQGILQGILASSGADTDFKSGHVVHYEFAAQEF
jgi:hypothetical protein